MATHRFGDLRTCFADSSRTALVLCVAALHGGAWAQEAESTPPPVASQMDSIVAMLTYAAIGVVFLAGVITFMSVRRRIEKHREAEMLAAQEFEAQMLRSLGQDPRSVFAHGATDAAPIPLTAARQPAMLVAEPTEEVHADPTPLSPYQPDVTPTHYRQVPEVAASSGAAERVDHVCRHVIEKLKVAGIMDGEIDQFIDVHGMPRAAASFRLRRGGHGLLLMSAESESYIHQQLKRFDLIVIGRADGKAYVVRSLENTIADRF